MSQRKKLKPTGLTSKLRDIPSIKKIDELVQGAKAFEQAIPVLGPFLDVIGVDVDKVKEGFGNIDFEKGEKLLSLPDRFNELFADHGWIIYDTMSATVAENAIEKAEAGDFAGAEEVLSNYYNKETIEMKLLIDLNKIKAFEPRMRLIKLALDDYLAGRYHASIPVVLALTDGLVNDLHPDHSGISAEKTTLQAWNSIAANSQGLDKLKGILFTGRRKTRTEQITLPYRHGILHGTDLGYDNITVAAKTWALLFAVGDWATKVEKGEIDAPEEAPPMTLSDLAERLEKSESLNVELENWIPRSSISIDPENFEVGSPEYALNEFLNYWMKKNYGKMAEILPLSKSEVKPPLRIKKHFKERFLKSFKVNSVVDVALGNTTIEVNLEIEKRARVEKKDYRFIMLSQDANGRTVSRNDENAIWVSNDWKVF